MWFNTSQTQQYNEGAEERDRRGVSNLETIGDIGKERAILSVTAIIGLSNRLHYVWFVFCLIRGIVHYATVDTVAIQQF